MEVGAPCLAVFARHGDFDFRARISLLLSNFRFVNKNREGHDFSRAGRAKNAGAASAAAERLNYFNHPHNVLVEFWKLTGRNPIFAVTRVSHDTNLIPAKEFGTDTELQNVSLIARRLILRIPIACNLSRVFLGEHGVEERLLW